MFFNILWHCFPLHNFIKIRFNFRTLSSPIPIINEKKNHCVQSRTLAPCSFIILYISLCTRDKTYKCCYAKKNNIRTFMHKMIDGLYGNFNTNNLNSINEFMKYFLKIFLKRVENDTHIAQTHSKIHFKKRTQKTMRSCGMESKTKSPWL